MLWLNSKLPKGGCSTLKYVCGATLEILGRLKNAENAAMVVYDPKQRSLEDEGRKLS